MSSGGEDHNDDNPSGLLQGSKKRRIQRACDICRKKKTRCDGPHMPGNRCTNCITWSFECTYVEAAVAKKRGLPKGYVENLENRMEKLENALRILCKDDSVLLELGVTLDRTSEAAGKSQQSYNPASSPRVPYDLASSVISKVGDPVDPSDDQLSQDDEVVNAVLTNDLERLQINKSDDSRYFGKSSGAMLVQAAMELKSEYTGTDYLRPAPPMILATKRPEFWSRHPWEQNLGSQPHMPKYVFPEDDLLNELVNLYFTHVNLYQPLLHRPTFEKSVADKLHLTNNGFAGTLLVVCAVGSRFSDDPRVLTDGVESPHSRGWKWFDQVQMIRKSLLASPSIYDMQYYCLTVLFLQDSSAPQSCWTLVGIGIRLAQEVGAHKRKARDHPLTVEDELWKRAFWILVCMDRSFSSAMGRSCAIQDEDFDLDMPIECDDEYWENPDPSQRFKQPPNKPSLITQFNLYLKLNQVLSFALRTIYSINKSKSLLGFVGPNWEHHIVAELDSALNKWVDSIPNHLRWDPNRKDIKFFNQSVVLYALYYQIQILVHRPFIPSPNKPSRLTYPSLAICTNAARSCSHIIDIQRERYPIPASLTQLPAFTSGVVLLLSIWGGKRSGISTDPNKEMVDVHKCMRMLRASENRWHSAGRLWDILRELATVGDFPLPQPSPPAANKRARYAEGADHNTMMLDNTSRDIAGSRRVSRDVSAIRLPLLAQQISPAIQQPEQHCAQPPAELGDQGSQPLPHQYFALPMYSNDLARLPDDHGQAVFSTGESFLDHRIPWSPPAAATRVEANPATNFPQFGPNASSSSSGFGYSHSDVGGMGSAMQGMVAGGSRGLSDAAGSEALHHYLTSLGSPFGGQNTGSSVAFTRDSMSVDGMYGGNQQFGGNWMTNPHPEQGPTQMPYGDMGLGHSHVEQQVQQPDVDQDMLAMWSTAPAGFELDEWGTYLMNVNELTQGHGQSFPRG